MNFEYAYALTGGISTGKSTVVKIAKLKGFRVIDADSIAHEVLDEKHEKIASMFGEEFVEDKKVNRKLLGKIIFSDTEKRKELEELLHPIIYKRIVEASNKLDKRGEPYIIDIPLFYEVGRYAIANVIVVYAPREKQVERLMKRDGLTKKEALERIDAQIDIEEKKKNAMYVIDNSNTLKHLEFEMEKIKEEILGDQF
ncbi:Dephospho-CoA kinase [hydrothermal vent metagenome]|uniref:Dephospho-CoA kinase n=1 Tax=hydrothermal vent metagenome TaxID=652676 RepID=A0A1W1EFR5_9ZZZZ